MSLSPRATAAAEALQASGREMGSAEIAKIIGCDQRAVRSLLRRSIQLGLIRLRVDGVGMRARLHYSSGSLPPPVVPDSTVRRIYCGAMSEPRPGRPYRAPSGRICWVDRVRRGIEGDLVDLVYEQDDGSLDPDDCLTLTEDAWCLLRAI